MTNNAKEVNGMCTHFGAKEVKMLSECVDAKEVKMPCM